MTLHLPDFRQEFLDTLAVDMWLTVADPSTLGSLPWEFYSEYDIPHEATATMVVFLCDGSDLDVDEESPDGTYFLHIELTRGDSEWADSGSLRNLNIDELKDRMCGLLEGRTIEANIRGTYCVDRSVLPKGGMIETLLGVSTSTCGSAMELRGSRFAIFGDTFSEIDWKYDEESDSIAGSIDGSIAYEVGDKILPDIADILQDGVECFVFESTQPEIKHAQRFRKRSARG